MYIHHIHSLLQQRNFYCLKVFKKQFLDKYTTQKMQVSICRYCTWPDKTFEPGGKNICKKCIKPSQLLSRYYQIQLHKNSILYAALIKLIIQFVMESHKTSKRKRSDTSYLHYDVVDPFGKIYSAKILCIQGSPLYTEIGLIKYDGWSNKWNEFVGIDSPRLIKHRKYSKSGETDKGITINEKTPEYENIKKEVDIAMAKWKQPITKCICLHAIFIDNL